MSTAWGLGEKQSQDGNQGQKGQGWSRTERVHHQWRQGQGKMCEEDGGWKHRLLSKVKEGDIWGHVILRADQMFLCDLWENNLEQPGIRGTRTGVRKWRRRRETSKPLILSSSQFPAWQRPFVLNLHLTLFPWLPVLSPCLLSQQRSVSCQQQSQRSANQQATNWVIKWTLSDNKIGQGLPRWHVCCPQSCKTIRISLRTPSTCKSPQESVTSSYQLGPESRALWGVEMFFHFYYIPHFIILGYCCCHCFTTKMC